MESGESSAVFRQHPHLSPGDGGHEAGHGCRGPAGRGAGGLGPGSGGPVRDQPEYDAARRAELEREGLLVTRRGIGSFVTEDRARLEALREEMARGLAQAYLEGMAGLGFGRAEAEARLKREGEE